MRSEYQRIGFQALHLPVAKRRVRQLVDRIRQVLVSAAGIELELQRRIANLPQHDVVHPLPERRELGRVEDSSKSQITLLVIRPPLGLAQKIRHGVFSCSFRVACSPADAAWRRHLVLPRRHRLEMQSPADALPAVRLLRRLASENTARDGGRPPPLVPQLHCQGQERAALRVGHGQAPACQTGRRQGAAQFRPRVRIRVDAQRRIPDAVAKTSG